MGKIGGFKEYNRTDESNTIVRNVSNYNEFTIPLSKKKEQGSRCMDGIPFCHSACPLGNLILILMTWAPRRMARSF
jgi:glutamate synthase (NADPH/NADH) small chain